MGEQEEQREEENPALIRGMRSTVGRESTTFGFSILVTVVFGVLQSFEGAPTTAEIFVYAAGAVMSFTVVEAVVSRGFRTALPQHHTRVLSLATSGNMLSVLAALTAGWGTAEVLQGTWTWGVAPWFAATTYLVVEGVNSTVAERILARREPDATDVED